MNTNFFRFQFCLLDRRNPPAQPARQRTVIGWAESRRDWSMSVSLGKCNCLIQVKPADLIVVT